MKEIIIIISILIIIFTGSIVTQKYLNRTSDLLVDDLEDIKNVSGIGDSVYEKIKDNITL